MHTLFAERLKKLRMDKNISQVQLAEQMFVTQSTVARWENGSRLPDAIMISRLSKLLDVDVNALEMATHSSILAWRIPCTEEPGGLQSMG